jgi:hypothetical protein
MPLFEYKCEGCGQGVEFRGHRRRGGQSPDEPASAEALRRRCVP